MLRQTAIASVVLFGGLAGPSCTADKPPLTDATDDVPTECTVYADQLVSYTQDGVIADGGTAALDAPDDVGVLLAVDDVLTVGFLGLGGVVEEMGDDILVHGTGSAEFAASAYISVDGEAFEYTGTLNGETMTLELNESHQTLALYVQLVGLEGTLSVDSFEALQTTCVSSDR